uniref:Uncharacterized protein n=1 Tax=Glossina morsitans morsitans TaxID=37546 RepID=A0A1B0GBA7_GLOMM
MSAFIHNKADNCGEIDEKEYDRMLMMKTLNKMIVMVGEHNVDNVRSNCLAAEAQQMNTTLLMILTKNSNLRFDETAGCKKSTKKSKGEISEEGTRV